MTNTKIKRPVEHESIYPLQGMSSEDIKHWAAYGAYKSNRRYWDKEKVIHAMKLSDEKAEAYEQWYQDDLLSNS